MIDGKAVDLITYCRAVRQATEEARANKQEPTLEEIHRLALNRRQSILNQFVEREGAD